jgi:hypothetical protein
MEEQPSVNERIGLAACRRVGVSARKMDGVDGVDRRSGLSPVRATLSTKSTLSTTSTYAPHTPTRIVPHTRSSMLPHESPPLRHIRYAGGLAN